MKKTDRRKPERTMTRRVDITDLNEEFCLGVLLPFGNEMMICRDGDEILLELKGPNDSFMLSDKTFVYKLDKRKGASNGV
jgi:hypothetical protein